MPMRQILPSGLGHRVRSAPVNEASSFRVRRANGDLAAFEVVERQSVKVVSLKRAGCLNLALIGSSAHSDQLLRVSTYYQTWAPSGQHVLTCAPQMAESVNQILDPWCVKRVLGLIYDLPRFPRPQAHDEDRVVFCPCDRSSMRAHFGLPGFRNFTFRTSGVSMS